MANNGYRIGAWAAVSIVALRLIIGWHFLSAGLEKFEPGWTSEGFLRSANGPMEDFYKSMAPLPHEWDKLVTEEWPGEFEFEKDRRYLSNTGLQEEPYVAERNEEKKIIAKMPDGSTAADDKVGHIPFPTKAYGPWASRIAKDWTDTAEKFKKIGGMTEEQIKLVDYYTLRQLERLSNYFDQRRAIVAEYHHELDRLRGMLDESESGKTELAYLEDRIKRKEAEVEATPRKWVADLEAEQSMFYEQLRSLVTEDQLKSATTKQRLATTFDPPKKIQTIDKVVTWVTLGVGLLLIFGLFTRLAAVVGAGFLLSVMSTQPPWAEGVLPTIRLLTAYQGIEFVALLVLAAIGAGTWAGLDGLLFRREE